MKRQSWREVPADEWALWRACVGQWRVKVCSAKGEPPPGSPRENETKWAKNRQIVGYEKIPNMYCSVYSYTKYQVYIRTQINTRIKN